MGMFRQNTAERVNSRWARSKSVIGSERTIGREQGEPMSPTDLSSVESLVGLRWHDGPDVRPVLLRVLTDLYIQKPSHSADEEQQYVELALRLLDVVDGSVRREVGRRLTTYGRAPVAVLRRLAADPAVTGPATHQAAAGPVERSQFTSALPAALPSPGSLLEDVACELNDIFFAASPVERRLIVINLDHSDAPPTPAMSAAYTDNANRDLETAALQGRLDEFIRELERVLMISREHAQRIVNDPSGEPLVVAAKALDMPIDSLQRILLCLNPAIGHSVRRVYSLSALYRDMSPKSALRLLAIWRAASPLTNATERQPMSPDDDLRSSRDYALARRSPARSIAEPSHQRHQRTR
jgi:hypothetical protein